MCVRIIKGNEQIKYDMSMPLKEQLIGSTEIIVNYQEQDQEVHHFLDQIEKYALTAASHGIKIKVLTNDLLNGARAKMKTLNATESMAINQLIKLMTLGHATTDKKLVEIAALCKNKDCDE